MVKNSVAPYNLIINSENRLSRNLNELYTNTTGRTMFLNVSAKWTAYAAGGWGSLNIEVDGVIMARIATSTIGSPINTNGVMNLTAFVKPGSTYIVNALEDNITWTTEYWTEAY